MPATASNQVSDGDTKLWGVIDDVADPELHQRFAQDLFDQTGSDIRGQEFDHCFRADVLGGSAVEVGDGHLDVTIWKEGEAERVVRKH